MKVFTDGESVSIAYRQGADVETIPRLVLSNA